MMLREFTFYLALIFVSFMHSSESVRGSKGCATNCSAAHYQYGSSKKSLPRSKSCETKSKKRSRSAESEFKGTNKLRELGGRASAKALLSPYDAQTWSIDEIEQPKKLNDYHKLIITGKLQDDLISNKSFVDDFGQKHSLDDCKEFTGNCDVYFVLDSQLFPKGGIWQQTRKESEPRGRTLSYYPMFHYTLQLNHDHQDRIYLEKKQVWNALLGLALNQEGDKNKGFKKMINDDVPSLPNKPFSLILAIRLPSSDDNESQASMDAENEDLYVIGHSKDLKLSKEVYDIRPKHNKEKNLWSLLLKMDEIKLQAKVTQDGNGKLQSFKDYVAETKQQEQGEEIAEQWTYSE